MAPQEITNAIIAVMASVAIGINFGIWQNSINAGAVAFIVTFTVFYLREVK